MEQDVLKLDGSHGPGLLTHLTITVSTPEGIEKSDTYEVPYAFIDFKKLQYFCDSSLILGYSVKKIFPADFKAPTIIFGQRSEEGE